MSSVRKCLTVRTAFILQEIANVFRFYFSFLYMYIFYSISIRIFKNFAPRFIPKSVRDLREGWQPFEDNQIILQD